MSWFKKNIWLFILILFVYGSFFLSHQKLQTTSVQVLGANTNLSLFEEPKDGKKPVIDEINTAQREVLVEVYLLSDKDIITSLVQAKERGVPVEVMLEQHPFGGANVNQKSKQTLEAAGIPVAWTNPAFSLTHEKGIIIDGNEAFILNQNLTTASFSKNREFDIIDNNPEDVTEIRTIFQDDWKRQSFIPTHSHLVISPDTSRTILTTFLQHATKTIDIEMEVIDDTVMVHLLDMKAKTDQIRLIIPPLSKISANAAAVHTLQQDGVRVKTISSPYIHAKMILEDDAQAYIGSINLTTQSMDQNRELGIIISQEDIIQIVTNDFENDWNRGADL